uniref:FGENESH: predicted gene_2.402 protein n=1 Tax=Rhodotorula toruloides TaxID=5286 RepID=A0A0K3C9Q7_RHOTO
MDSPSPGDSTTANESYATASQASDDLVLAESLLSLSLNHGTQTGSTAPGLAGGAPVKEEAITAELPTEQLPAASTVDTSTPSVAPPRPRRPRTAVTLQPACANHRYIRNTDIGTIVERPERLRAVKVGVAAAWARLEEREVAQGGERWRPIEAKEVDQDSELDALLGGLSIGGAGKTSVETRRRKREVVGGPFDILESSAVLALDNSALRYIHSKPNLSPDDEANEAAWTSASSDSSPDPPSAPVTGPTPRAPAAPPAWPTQLQRLCRQSASAVQQPPHSEIPAHLPQGDLYLCPGSEEAIFGALGAVCEGVDRLVAGGQDAEQVYDRAFVSIRPPGHHCGEANPQGFCFVNNVAVAAAHAHLKHGINRVVILDIDLHHGNGTQEVAWLMNAEANRILTERRAKTPSASPRKGTGSSPKKTQAPLPAPTAQPRPLQIMYASLHDIWSYPCEDGDPGLVAAASTNLAGGHGQWISNVHLEAWRDEQHFHNELYPMYREGLLGRAEEFCRKVEEEGEVAGEKTLVIVSAAFVARGKVLAVLEGGYSDRALASSTASFLTGLVSASGSADPQDPPASVEEDAWWTGATLKKLEKACSVAKSRRAAAPPTLVGVDASAEPWLSRSVDIFSQLEDIAAASSKASTSAVTTGQTDTSPTTSRQLRERRARPNYAGLDDGSTPLPSPTRSTAIQPRRMASSSRLKAEKSGPPDLPPPVPTLPVPPTPEATIYPPPSSESTVYDAPTAAPPPPPPPSKQMIRFTWKEGGFSGAPGLFLPA